MTPSIRYITGAPAQAAQQEMADFSDLADIVDVEDHDLVNSRGLRTQVLTRPTLASLTTQKRATIPLKEPMKQRRQKKPLNSGLLPFVSPLTVIALIGLAAVAGNRRTENE